MSKSTDYKNKFIAENYDRIYLTVPKGIKDLLKEHCDNKSLSINGYILDLIRKDLNLADAKDTSSAKQTKEMDIFLF